MRAISRHIKPIPFNDLQAQHHEIENELKEAFARVLHSGWFVLGKELEAFESEFANYIGVRHCIGVGNGLDALVVILKALNIGPGDEVIVPAHTFIATWLAVTLVGATPVPVLTNQFHVINPQLLTEVISKRTKAIIAVHLYGHPADVDAISSTIENRNIYLIEDAAQAHGATYKNKKTGNLGIAAAFSFYPGKNLGALGDGGAITTNDDALANKVASLRNYGSCRKYQHEMTGINSRLDEMQAAFLRIKLKKLDQWNKRRQEIAAVYLKKLKNCTSIRLPDVADFSENVWHQFVIQTKNRDALQTHLACHGIQTLIHYPIANHKQAAYANQFDENRYLDYQHLVMEILSLPICPTLNDEQIIFVCDVIREFMASQAPAQ